MNELVRPTHLLDQLAENGAYDQGLYLSDPNVTYDQLEALGALLKTALGDIRWAIGDWLLLVEAMFPNQFSQALEVLEMNPEGARDYMRISARVPRSLRRKGVSWSHHRALASLKMVDSETGEVLTDHASQREWLDRIEEEGMPVRDLWDHLRPEAEPELDPQVCPSCNRPL